jgi:hypothetical protein
MQNTLAHRALGLRILPRKFAREQNGRPARGPKLSKSSAAII